MFKFDAKPSRRKGSRTWEIRVRVPERARSAMRMRGEHTTRTLGTTDKRKAMLRAPVVLAALEAEMEAVVGGAPVGFSSADVVTEAEVLRALSWPEVCHLYREYLERREQDFRLEHFDSICEFSPHVTYERLFHYYSARLRKQIAEGKGKLAVRDFHLEHFFLYTLRQSKTGTYNVNFEEVCALAELKLATWERILAQGKVAGLHATVAPTGVNSHNPVLSAVVNSYIEKRGSGLSIERADTIRATVRDLIALVGDKPVSEYTCADADVFEEAMLALPANWQKKRGLRELRIEKAADLAKEQGLPRQSAKNIRKKWTVLAGIFKYAQTKHGARNFFASKSLIVSDGGVANAQWSPFKPHELGILLASNRPGELHWLTLLGLFTGARLNELAQLDKSHIKRHGDLWFIHIGPDLRLKNQASVRSVPIHCGLIEHGFLKFVAQCDHALFPDLAKHKSGRFSDAPSKAFARHLEHIGIARGKLSFNSLRHTFIARMKTLAPEYAETRERLVGHTVKGVAGRYGDDFVAEASDMELLAQRAKVLALFDGRANGGPTESTASSVSSL